MPLAAFPTRYSTSTHYTNDATWAQNQLKALHYPTRLQTIMVNGSRSRNVIADTKGNAAGRHEVVLITAHLDSINIQGGPTAPAPGADDNGSGSAGLLEIARAFAEHHIEHDLHFILFGGEEEGPFGSQQYVAKLSASEKGRIRAVVNMDMIGTLNTPTRSVLPHKCADNLIKLRRILQPHKVTVTFVRVEDLDPHPGDLLADPFLRLGGTLLSASPHPD